MGPAEVDSDLDDGWCLVEKPSGAAGSAAPNAEERWVVTPVENPCGRATYVRVSGPGEAPRDAGDENDSVACGSEDSTKSGGRQARTRTRKPCTGKTKTKSGRQRKKKLAPFCGRTLYP